MSGERRWHRPTEESLEREGRALTLYCRRATYREIAEDLGVNVSAAHKMVRRAMQRFLRDHGAEDVRADILARTDFALTAIMPGVEKGDPAAIDRMLKLDRQLRDLFGLDAPKVKKIDLFDRQGVERELEEMSRRLGRPVPPRIIDTNALPALPAGGEVRYG